MEFLVAAGQIFGTVLSLVVLVGAVRVGRTYGTLTANAETARKSSERTEALVIEHGPRIQKIEQTLHGPQGQNGMYGAVRDLQISVQEIKDQRTGPADRRNAPRRPKTDRRKSA